MGLFSYNCQGCGHPMLHPMSTDKVNHWMNFVMVIEPDGTQHKGWYDGYGRIEGHDGPIHTLSYPMKEACWHNACWEVAGKPGYTNPSENAEDQGHFFEPGAHSMKEPEVST